MDHEATQAEQSEATGEDRCALCVGDRSDRHCFARTRATFQRALVRRAAPAESSGRRLFLGGLPYQTEKEALYAHFSEFGEVEEAVSLPRSIVREA